MFLRMETTSNARLFFALEICVQVSILYVFSFFRKYERSKEVLTSFKSNEDRLKVTVEDLMKK